MPGDHFPRRKYAVARSLQKERDTASDLRRSMTLSGESGRSSEEIEINSFSFPFKGMYMSPTGIDIARVLGLTALRK